MAQHTPSQIGLVRLDDSVFVLRDPGQDPRGKVAYGAGGERLGDVEGLYIDGRQRRVRFMEVGVGGLLGLGRKPILVPVGSIREIAGDRVVVVPEGDLGTAEPPPFDTRVTLPDAGGRNVPPRGGDAAERNLEELPRFPYGSRPY